MNLLLLLLWVLAPVSFVVLCLMKKAEPRVFGYFGEQRVKLILEELDPEEYLVLNDLLLKNGDHTTQIDQVVVSRFGIFVIEMKNYSGTIYGRETDQQWTQVIGHGKFQFYNPLRQNHAHVCALRGVLSGMGDVRLVPLVVFSPLATLKVEVEDGKVIHTPELVNTILAHAQPVMSPEARDKAYARILTSNITGKDSRRRHTGSVKLRVAEAHSDINRNVCPRCGGQLVLRRGKYGPFKGCSNFPKGCRFTAKA